MPVKKLSDTNTSLPHIPFAQICNNVIENIKDDGAFRVWCYLLSKSRNWKVIKNHIKNKFGYGNNKINKIFSYLHRSNLVQYVQMHSEKGKFAQTRIDVLSGDIFDKNQPFVECTPVVQKVNVRSKNVLHTGGSVSGSTCNENLLNKERIQKKDLKSFCAANAAPVRFEVFWNIFPIKKNKRRAQEIWKRKDYDKIAELICKDVETRKSQDHQWQEVQFIPHPSTYLAGERWNDEITKAKTKKNGVSAFSEFMNSSKTNQGAIYDASGNEFNPFN